MAKPATAKPLWLVLAYACALAYGETAHAQWGDPWDSDFAAPAPAVKRPLPSKPEPKPPSDQPPVPVFEQPRKPAAGVEIPEWMRNAGPFLLLDRPDAGRIFKVDPSTAPRPVDFQEFLLEQRAFELDPDSWNRMREHFEQGILPERDFEPGPMPPPSPYDFFAATALPKPPEPTVELPTYGTSLSITGRKVIGFTFSQKRFTSDQTTTGRAKSSNLIDIEQQLQLRMQGKVGPKITVNVDYDDTKTNKQDISVVYTGDPSEVVQNASFGDIDLSLPATEFVSYNKQLFGIRINLKYKRLKAIFLGSRTKGVTKIKQFKGNTQLVSVDINDTSYARRKYYDLSFSNPSRLPLQAGSERIFLSLNQGGIPNVDELTLAVNDLDIQTSTFTDNRFRELVPGRDYTVDYVKGILTFRNTLDPASAVAVDFIDASGNSISIQTSSTTTAACAPNIPNTSCSHAFKLIKTPSDVQISTPIETGYRREMKTFYSIGRQQIVRDDGRGNFFLRVLDTNRAEIGSAQTPIQKYPDTIAVDFENGLFQLDQKFNALGSTAPATSLYAPVPVSQGILFHAEFRFRLKTYFLEPNLVLQSEVVLIDAVRLTRNVDYFIDYESGFLSFFNEERIKENSVIDVTYEVAPFAGVTTESLLGTRVSYDISNKWSIGSTLLFQTGSKSPTTPTINELAKSLLVYEFDTQLKDIKIMSWLSASFAAELAQSIQNPNLSGKAIIDNMEGVKQDDSASTLHTSWRYAANPTGDEQWHPDTLTTFTTEDVPVLEINPTAPANQGDSQKVLTLGYDFTNSSTFSLVYVFSPTGIDFSQKNIIEVTMFGVNQEHEINFRLGTISEDADADGVFDTEDNNDDKQLQPDEDIGWTYNPPAHPISAVHPNTAGNGRIDSEDLDNNGKFDTADDFSGDNFGYLGSVAAGNNILPDVDGNDRTTLKFTGWHTFQIPLNISTETASNWTAIKQLRISIRKGNSPATSGSIKFARIAVVGNSWQRGAAGDPKTGQGPIADESLTVNAVNNVDNPGYLPIFSAGGEAGEVFDELFGGIDELQQANNSDNLQEQALELNYANLARGTTVFTKRIFGRAIDISQHKKFSFLIYGDAPPASGDAAGDRTFFLRAGSNSDFFEVRVPMDSAFTGKWRRITLNQVDVTGDQIPDIWEADIAGIVVITTGAPKLQQIGQLVAGLYSVDTTGSGRVWLNEIHVTDPIKRKGTAQKLQADFTIPGWGTFGAKYRFVDRSFQTPTTLVSNQDNRQDSAYLTLSRIKMFPMSFNVSRSIVTTANTNAVGDNSNLVNLLQEGKVTAWTGSAKGNFSYRRWPTASLGYDRSLSDFAVLQRVDDRRTIDTSMAYTVPGGRRFLPKTIGANYRTAQALVKFQDEARFVAGRYDTDERTDTYGLRMSFTPWNGSSFNPSASLTTVRERRTTFFATGGSFEQSYDKSRNQQAGFTSTWKLLKWFKPTVSYNITMIETSILNISTFIVQGTSTTFDIGKIKTVNRNATGNIGLTLNIAQIFKGTKLFRSASLTNSYQVQDGDVWNNVEGELDNKFALWVRTPLKPTSPFAVRQNLTLRDTINSTQRWSPLEAYKISGRKSALRTLSLTNNFVKSTQRSETTNTPSKTITTTLPDLIASITQLEKIFYAEKWMRNLQLNAKFSKRNTRVVGISLDRSDAFGSDLRAMIRRKYDTSLSFNLRSSRKEDLRINKTTQRTNHKDATLQTTFNRGKFRFTPKMDWARDTTTLGTGQKTSDLTTLTPSVLVRADISLPRGLYLPFVKRTLKFTNRVIWTTTLSLAMRSSPITIADNSKLLSVNTSADYEIAKNLRMTLNGAMSRLWHKHLKENEFISYQFGTTLTFQF